MRRAIAYLTAAVVLGSVALGPAAIADTQQVRTWSAAAQAAGQDGSLWQPTYRAGLKLSGPIDVVQDTYDDGSKAMSVGAMYGNNKRGFTILQTYDGYTPALDAAPDRSAAPVGTFTVRLGDPGTTIPIRVRVDANCWEPEYTANPTPAPKDFRCSKADVKKYGATLTMTARPPSTMTAPGTTDIIIQSQGITFRQLLRIASNLKQIMG